MSLNSFFTKLVPKEKKFFPIFEQLAEINVQSATILLQVFEHEDPVKEKDQIKAIKKLEQAGDKVSQELFDFLDQTFVTPFDREDIHHLTASLDRLLDLMKSVSQKILMYRPKEFPVECKEMAAMIVASMQQMQAAVGELRSLKKTQQILKNIKKISKIESETDDLYHSAISGLFKNEKDAIELIKKKEIVERLEQISDEVEIVAGVLRTIVLKNA